MSQMTTNTCDYDRRKELEVFEDTKLGVKGLVDSGITHLPRIFHHPPETLFDHEQPHANLDGEPIIPVIDLSGKREEVVKQLRDASAKFGFFQVINHGMSVSFLDHLLDAIKAFHELQPEEKIQVYHRETVTAGSGVGFYSNYDLFHSKAASWRDTLAVRLAPVPVDPNEIPGFMEKTEKPRAPVIIALKGHPGTGKSTIASAISAALRCPLIDKDDIRDATLSLSSAASYAALNNLSYDAMWRVASTQIQLGLSVVVDSPLSRRHHLDAVVRIAGGSHRVLIVECRPSDEAEWRRQVEVRGAEEGGAGHKPATWQDIERLLEGYDGCTEYDVGEVPKLIVDTTDASGGVDGVLSSVLEFIETYCGDHHS